MATTAPVTGRASKKNKSSENGVSDKPSITHSTPQRDDLALILASLQTMRDGDFSVRLPVAWVGLEGKIADTFNDIVAANEQMAAELNRVGQAVGKEGKNRNWQLVSLACNNTSPRNEGYMKRYQDHDQDQKCAATSSHFQVDPLHYTL